MIPTCAATAPFLSGDPMTSTSATCLVRWKRTKVTGIVKACTYVQQFASEVENYGLF
jgi:hypothetical protein